MDERHAIETVVVKCVGDALEMEIGGWDERG